MLKTSAYIALFLLSLSSELMAGKPYTEVPALIHLNKEEQEDSNGFNLVEFLPEFMYRQIQSGKVILWDSPKKQIEISFAALSDIEKSNNVSFAKTRNLFINELWSGTRRRTEFVIIGFSFLSESAKGKISFGYVDMKDVIQLLANNNIPCNVNGPAQLTYLNALYSRRYQFNLVQFGNKDFSVRPELSIRIRNEAFYSKKKVQGISKMPLTKMVTYTIEKNPGQPNDIGTACFQTIENYLNENKEVLFNLGGSQYFDFHNRLLNIAITRIEVTEVWTRKGKNITFSPYQITIYANNKPLNTISIAELDQWNLLIGFKTLEDIFIEKSFQYNLYKLNKDLIHISESGYYIKALLDYKWSWTQVSKVVQHSRN